MKCFMWVIIFYMYQLLSRPSLWLIFKIVVKNDSHCNPPCLGSDFSHYLSFRAASAPPSPVKCVCMCQHIVTATQRESRRPRVLRLHPSFITFLSYRLWPPPLSPTAMLASWLPLECRFPGSGGANKYTRVFFVIVWDFVRVRWCFTGRQRAPGSLFSLCHNPLIAARHGASSDHPGSSGGRSCSPEGARLFWSPLSRHHWCSRCWPGAPRSQVWTPGLPAVPGERAWAWCWSPGLEQGHTSTWCGSYWQHPGAAVACARRRLQHWGKYIHS